MATGGDVNLTDGQAKRRKIDGDLTDSQIEGLAREMEARSMASIAIKDLGIGIETVNNLKLIRQGDYIAFNRDLLVLWRNKNPGSSQVQVSLFYNFEYFKKCLHVTFAFAST